MGVPISFLDKYCPEQFEIVGATESEGKGFSCGLWNPASGVAQPMIDGNRIYKRIFIRKRGRCAFALSVPLREKNNTKENPQ